MAEQPVDVARLRALLADYQANETSGTFEQLDEAVYASLPGLLADAERLQRVRGKVEHLRRMVASADTIDTDWTAGMQWSLQQLHEALESA